MIPATQQFVDVKDVKDGVIRLKRGGFRRVLAVSGINFDLKSEEEREIILRSYQAFLNTLDFSVQFFIHSRKVNVSSYLRQIEERRAEEENELLKIQIEDYMNFIRSFVEENPIVTKSFFVVVPYDAAAFASPTKGFMNIFRPSPTKAKTDERIEDQKALLQLEARVDEVSSGLQGIGLHAHPLDDDEIAELFYNLYNPELIEKEGFAIAGPNTNDTN
ncbi:hypothetical protein A3A21_02545 [Candidatus Jorgensenbacteria bacterium RIFCSPLOWO2_01_FULL_45_25b]|uniref:TraC-like domain-containing protein n=1 Tax=Candidatus Jorgensenbacteria bacterium RIFCSPLOWO2_01_FULL_45_25b TaxID=1798471 RepID=A0A1F6BTI7_9BACT|nr:MAG: hypothetical protein A3A21_02545 [Candidatus Jorgensenbacteria bacterium RIFCSPLOWO2_01_FULL_45_25b]